MQGPLYPRKPHGNGCSRARCRSTLGLPCPPRAAAVKDDQSGRLGLARGLVPQMPSMRLIREGQAFLARFSLLLLLSSCGEAEEEAEQCRSLDARSSVLKIFSDDENNALVTFALKNSSKLDAMTGTAKSEIEKLAILDNTKRSAVYRLGDTILMKSRDRAAREVTCNGVLSVTVLDTSAEKEIEFKVKQTTDRTPLVSVSPFLFK